MWHSSLAPLQHFHSKREEGIIAGPLINKSGQQQKNPHYFPNFQEISRNIRIFIGKTNNKTGAGGTN